MDGELRFFYCGDGDTILIRGGNEWALVDGNLTPSTRERLEKVLRENHVEELRFVCATHFDTDHIRGLGRFLTEHFRTELPDGTVDWRIGQVILPFSRRDFLPLLYATPELLEHYLGENADATRAMTELVRMINDMNRSTPPGGVCKVTSYSPTQRLTSPDESPRPIPFGPWDVWFLGPKTDTVTNHFWTTFGSEWNLVHWPKEDRPKHLQKKVGANDLSQIMALCNRDNGKTILLTGDATASELKEALRVLEIIRKEALRPPDNYFHIVKASHHGAWTNDPETNCHYPPIYQGACAPDKSCVIISALGNFEHHPHENVLREIIGAGIPSRLTGFELNAGRAGSKKSYLPGAPVQSPQTKTADVIVSFQDRPHLQGGRDGGNYYDRLSQIRSERANAG